MEIMEKRYNLRGLFLLFIGNITTGALYVLALLSGIMQFVLPLLIIISIGLIIVIIVGIVMLMGENDKFRRAGVIFFISIGSAILSIIILLMLLPQESFIPVLIFAFLSILAGFILTIALDYYIISGCKHIAIQNRDKALRKSCITTWIVYLSTTIVSMLLEVITILIFLPVIVDPSGVPFAYSGLPDSVVYIVAWLLTLTKYVFMTILYYKVYKGYHNKAVPQNRVTQKTNNTAPQPAAGPEGQSKTDSPELK